MHLGRGLAPQPSRFSPQLPLVARLSHPLGQHCRCGHPLGKPARLANVPRSVSDNGAYPDGHRECDGDSHGRHAVLHDFCMSIPFGAILVAAGLVGAFTGFGSAASLHIAGLGALSMVVSSVSLARWKVNESSLPFTAANAIISVVLAHWMWLRAKLGMAVVGSKAIMFLSATMALFLVYNMVAGGNPPKREKSGVQERVDLNASVYQN